MKNQTVANFDIKSKNEILLMIMPKKLTKTTSEIVVKNMTLTPFLEDAKNLLLTEYFKYLSQLRGYIYKCKTRKKRKAVVINFNDYDCLLEVNNEDLKQWMDRIWEIISSIGVASRAITMA